MDGLPERVHGGRPASARVLASWQRSQEYGVSLDQVQPAFTGALDTESLFFQCGDQVLRDLKQTLAGEPISLMLTDSDGLVLNRHSGDDSLLRALDAVHLAPGFGYSEREAGTNGLGLALADRSPTVVRAKEHYAQSLTGYTCAAAPVLDPTSGRLQGAVNLTTWSDSSHDLLLALAQSAASNTTALMLTRSQGRTPRPAPRGEVFRVVAPHLEPGSGSTFALSTGWGQALDQASAALAAGRVVAAVGEAGAGRVTLLSQALRRVRPRSRILSASAPAPQDLEPWLMLWTPEVGKPDTAVIVGDVDVLPLWAADRLAQLLAAGEGVPVVLTAERLEDVPGPLLPLIETVVQLPALRERPEDVVPIALHVAARARGREVEITAAARRALSDHSWPGNVTELVRVIRHAAMRADVIDVRHLPPSVLSAAARRLSRIERFERDEIVRALSRPGTTMQQAAAHLGMSRATLYRKVSQYGVHVPRA